MKGGLKAYLSSGPGVVDITAQVLGAHDAVGTTVGLTGDDGEFWHGGLGVSIDELGSVTDDAAVLLSGTGQEAGHIDEGDKRNVEGIAETHETSALDGGIDVQATGSNARLVGNNTDGLTTKATQTDHEVLGVVGHDFEEFTLINGLLQCGSKVNL